MSPWATLGIEPTHDIRAIKKAYSVQLKTTRPDDDAAAYQALREAYEAAQWWVRHGLVTPGEEVAAVSEHTEPVVVERSAAGEMDAQAPRGVYAPPGDAVAPESRPEVPFSPELPADASESALSTAQGPSVARLLQSCAAILVQEGEAHFVRMWPGLQRQLEDLPIAAHQEANRSFAAFVVQQDVPVEVLIALTRYFQWGLDYRVDTQLGHELSLALQSTLQQAHVYAALNRQPDPADTWCLALAKLADQGRTQWLRILAVCMDHTMRQRVVQSSPMRLRALGASKKASQAVVAAAALGGIWQAMMLLALFMVAAQGLHALNGPSIGQADWPFTGLCAALLLAMHSYSYRLFPELDRLWPRLRLWVSIRDWRRCLQVSGSLIPLFFFVAWSISKDMGIHRVMGIIESVDMLIPLSVVYFSIWLVIPTDLQAWRKLFLPTFVLLLLGLAELFPKLSHAVVLSLAFGGVLVAHVVLSRFNLWFEAFYLGFVKLRFLRERPFLIFGIKFIGAAWLLYVLVCLPAFLFRLCAQCGLLFAQAALVGGVLLSGAASTGASWLLVWIVAAVFAIQCAQWGLQKIAAFGLRKLVV